MSKDFGKVVPMLMIGLFCLLFMPQITFAGSSTVLGTAWGAFSSDAGAMDASIANMMANYSNTAGYTGYNWNGESTTRDHIYQAAEGVGAANSIAFYVGHGTRDFLLIDLSFHYGIITNNGAGDIVYDRDIYPHSVNQNLRFVFLWSCKQADEIGFGPSRIGMPVCWLHLYSGLDISNDGYNSPDGKGRSFIGFSGFVPGLADDYFTEGETYSPDTGYHFLRYFYWRTLLFGST